MEESLQTATEQPKISQDQIHGLLFGDKLSWQAIIYDLINTEQLNPWDIDLCLLSQRFLERVRALEEANFFISSKVLAAAALLLRIKSEILLEYDIRSLDDILFGKKEEKVYKQERIELNEEIPELVVRTPLPRYKKVTLEELMNALGKAIKTETRRIQRVVVTKQQEMETAASLPKERINIQDRIKEVYQQLQEKFANQDNEVAFSNITGETPEEKIATFVPLLHLDNQQKVWLEQHGHLQEIWILLKHLYEKKNSVALEEMRKEVDAELARLSIEEKALEEKEKEEEIRRKTQKNKKKKSEEVGDTFDPGFTNPVSESAE